MSSLLTEFDTFLSFLSDIVELVLQLTDVAILFSTVFNICKYIITNLFLCSTKRTIMSTCTWIIVLPVIVIALGAIQLRTASAAANKSTASNENGDDEHEKNPKIKDLKIAWIEMPPYLTSPTNESLDDKPHGMLRDVFLRYIARECGGLAGIFYHVKTF